MNSGVPRDEKSPVPVRERGKCLGRTVGQVIPRQVASPQSLTPFGPARAIIPESGGTQLASNTINRVYRPQDHWLGLN